MFMLSSCHECMQGPREKQYHVTVSSKLSAMRKRKRKILLFVLMCFDICALFYNDEYLNTNDIFLNYFY